MTTTTGTTTEHAAPTDTVPPPTLTPQQARKIARAQRNAKAKLMRAIGKDLHAHLDEIVKDNLDGFILTLAAGGAVRVNVEVAMPAQEEDEAADDAADLAVARAALDEPGPRLSLDEIMDEVEKQRPRIEVVSR